MGREGWKQISVWVPVGVLEDFDEWVHDQRARDRSAALVELMEAVTVTGRILEALPESAAVVSGFVNLVADEEARNGAVGAFDAAVAREASRLGKEMDAATLAAIKSAAPAKEKPEVLGELREKIDAIQANCSHPKEKRRNLGYGTRCEECGGMVK